MSSFEEEFPSLKNSLNRISVNEVSEDLKTHRNSSCIYLRLLDVTEHCLDKQRVREAVLEAYDAFQDDASAMYDHIIKELEL